MPGSDLRQRLNPAGQTVNARQKKRWVAKGEMGEIKRVGTYLYIDRLLLCVAVPSAATIGLAGRMMPTLTHAQGTVSTCLLYRNYLSIYSPSHFSVPNTSSTWPPLPCRSRLATGPPSDRCAHAANASSIRAPLLVTNVEKCRWCIVRPK